jgi:hypothetical protein
LVLEGQLIEPWVTGFKKAWQEASRSPNGQKLVVDLCEVTVVSSQAEALLLEIRCAGAISYAEESLTSTWFGKSTASAGDVDG